MRQELDKILCLRCPKLYADRWGNMAYTCMCWGFETDDGWYELIYKLSARLENLINQLPPQDQHKYKAVQVKEKFGELRFYMTMETPEMEALIDAAEEESAHICEICGRRGKTRDLAGWLQTLCFWHHIRWTFTHRTFVQTIKWTIKRLIAKMRREDDFPDGD